MKTIATLAASIALCGPALAQVAPTPVLATGQGFGYSIAYDFTAHQTLAIGSYSVNLIPNTFGVKGLNLSGVGFGGSSLGSEGLTGGVGLGLSGVLGKLNWVVAGGEGFFVGSTPHFLVFAGIRGGL